MRRWALALALALVLAAGTVVAAVATAWADEDDREQRAGYGRFGRPHDDDREDDDHGDDDHEDDDREDDGDADGDDHDHYGDYGDYGFDEATTSSPPAAPSLPAAVAAVLADPGRPEAVAALQVAAAAAGPGAPRLWVKTEPVPAAGPVSVVLPAVGDVVFVPLPPVAASMGVPVQRDEAGRLVLTRAGRTVALAPGSDQVWAGNLPLGLDHPPVWVGGTPYVTLYTLAELLVAQVVHDGGSGLVMVNPAPVAPIADGRWIGGMQR